VQPRTVINYRYGLRLARKTPPGNRCIANYGASPIRIRNTENCERLAYKLRIARDPGTIHRRCESTSNHIYALPISESVGVLGPPALDGLGEALERFLWNGTARLRLSCLDELKDELCGELHDPRTRRQCGRAKSRQAISLRHETRGAGGATKR
jgi:hypothetical protein